MHDIIKAIVLLVFIALCLAGSVIAIMHEKDQRDIEDDD